MLLSLRDANWEMRKNYAKMIEDVGKNIFPLIVVTDAEPDYKGVGGVFKVYLRDGSMKVRIVHLTKSIKYSQVNLKCRL